MEKMKWGIISAYGIAQKRTIPAVLKLDDTEIAGVTSHYLEEAREVAKRFNIPEFFDNTDELLALDDLDAVYIASPVFLHYKNAVKAAEAGKHILCEKPVALSLEEAEKIREICKENKVKFMVGFMMRFHGAHKKVKKMIEEGEIGRPILARAQLSHYKAEWGPEGGKTWRQNKKLAGGGSLMDMGIHCVDLLRYWLGEVEGLYSFVDTLENDYDVEDTASILLKFKNGAQGIVDSCFNVKGAKNIFEVYGTEGFLRGEKTIDQLPTGSLFFTRDNQEKEIDFPVENMYAAEVEYFNECIREDKQPFLDIEEGMDNQRIVSSAYRSSKQREFIKI